MLYTLTTIHSGDFMPRAFIERARALVTHGPDLSNAEAWQAGLLQLDELAGQVRDRLQSLDARALWLATHALAIEAHYSVMNWRVELCGPIAIASRMAAVRAR